MQEAYSHFMGEDGFIWFTGVVEDRNDPASLGRVRVRCLGHHTEDLNDIPTKDLPWAHVMHSVTSPSMQGLGHTPSFLVEGTWVIGFFLDAIQKQQPMIIGSLPGIPTRAPDYTKGFNDPRSPFSSQPEYAGTPTYGPYPVNKFDYKIPSGHGLGEPDTNRLAQGEASESHLALVKMRENRQTGIQTATQPNLTEVSDEAVAEDRGSFDEPHPRDIDYNSVDGDDYGIYRGGLYPYNHVFESESGHLTEVDDTPGNERTMRYHTAGTYEEIIADGTKTTKVIGDNFEIIMQDSNVYIGGAVNLTIGGTVRHLVKGDYHLEVEGNYTQKIHKNFRRKVGAGEIGGNVEEEIFGGHAYNISGATRGRHGEDVDIIVGGNETRQVNGTSDLSVRSNIFATSLTGNIDLAASNNLSLSTTSGIFSAKSGTTLNIKSGEAMTIKSETTLTETVTTNAVRTVGGTMSDTITGVGTITMAASGSEVNASGILLTQHTHTDPAGLAGSETSTPN
jgi:hypothetical protein